MGTGWVRAASFAATLLVMIACGGDEGGSDAADAHDAGRTDAASHDGGPHDDAGPDDLDAGTDAAIDDAGGVVILVDAGVVVDADVDGGIDAGLDAHVAVDVDAGAGAVDAGIDAGAVDAGIDSGSIDAAPIDAATPSGRIELVRGTNGPLATPIHIDTVQITYVLPPVGDDPGGVFVQSDLLGPALFVAIDPATLSPPPVVGAYAGFSVTETAVVDGQHRVTGILAGSWFSGSTPVGGVVAEPQGLRSIDVPASLDELESELTVNELDMAGDLVACGRDRFCARVTSSGVPTATASYRVRITQSVASALGLARRCHLVLGEYPSALGRPTPLWRRGAEANPLVTAREELTSVACPLGRLLGAYATGAASVTLVFDAPIDPATVAASDFTWTGGVSTVAAAVSTASPYLVVLTTSALAAGSSHSVSVSGSLRDVLGIDVLSGTSATLTARAAGSAPNAAGQIVVSEIMSDPGGADPASEWIELANPGTAALTLTGCTLRDGSGAAGHTLGALTIAGGDRVVLASAAAPGLATDQIYGSALVLDATDSVELACAGVVIDRVEWSSAFPAATGRSLSLDPQHHAAALNDVPVAWCTARSSYAGRHGTPGGPNDDCR